jgi:hypothetical protein
MNFNVISPTTFSNTLAALGTLDVPVATTEAPTSGIIVDNLSSTAGYSEIYFLTVDPTQTNCTGGTSAAGVCAVQASQVAP